MSLALCVYCVCVCGWVWILKYTPVVGPPPLHQGGHSQGDSPVQVYRGMYIVACVTTPTADAMSLQVSGAADLGFCVCSKC